MTAAPTWVHVFVDVPMQYWERSVAFWSAATATEASAPWGDEGQYLTLVPAAGDGWVHLQRIDGPPRVHLDLDSGDPVTARAESTALGATPLRERPEALVMESPGGLVFCHSHDGGRELVRSDRERVIDQVCIDVPETPWETEAAFWSAVTGRALADDGAPEFDLLDEPGRVRILLQRLGEEDGPVRTHLDLATASRLDETRRHEGLGAQLVAVFERWTVMRAPDGRDYCLTDRNPLTGTG